jgi:DNA topoisomerase-1
MSDEVRNEQPFRELWIIEAPGKAKTLEATLRRLGLDARVAATKGHLLSYPDRLTPLGIDRLWREPGRSVREPERVVWLRKRAALASRLVIATDADQEGDVIAWDVAELLSDIHPSPLRVKLKALDDDSVLAAADEARTIERDDAIPGRARALVDRLIGGTFSGDGVAVGRVGTAILGLFAPGQPKMTASRLKLAAPAADGGNPWLADTPIVPPLDYDIALRLRELNLPKLPVLKFETEVRKPHHTGDILSRASDVLGLKPSEAMKSLQRNYEAGRMSYPRSSSRALSDVAAQRIEEIIRAASHKFDSSIVQKKGDEDVHDAPHPIGPAPNLAANPEKMDPDEGLRIMVARDLVRAGQQQVVESPDLEPLRRFLLARGFQPIIIEMICSLKWKREKGPRYPGQEAWTQSEVYERDPAAVLLDRIVEAGIGRASTWASHVDGFMARGLIDENMELTAKGQRWMELSPPHLLNPQLSAVIEKAFERKALSTMNPLPGELPWETMARNIVTRLPSELKSPILEKLAAQPTLDERIDPWNGLRVPVEVEVPEINVFKTSEDEDDKEGLPPPQPPAYMFPGEDG